MESLKVRQNEVKKVEEEQEAVQSVIQEELAEIAVLNDQLNKIKQNKSVSLALRTHYNTKHHTGA